MATSDAKPISSWDGPHQLPTTDCLGVQIPEGTSPVQVSRDWLDGFCIALQSRRTQIQDLFLDDSFWRDLLALSWDIRTLIGATRINDYLEKHLANSGLRDLTISDKPWLEPTLEKPYPDLTFVQFAFTFENAVGIGSGLARLVYTGGVWKAWTMFTSLGSLREFPEKIGPLRDATMYQGTWTEKRRAETDMEGGKPAVVIVGAGHSGLETAARLKYIGVRALVVEKNAKIGDNWRHRYKTLSLHDTVWFDHLPYMLFPSTWPVYAPAQKLGDFLESYAHHNELDVWTSSTVKAAQWNEKDKTWAITVQRRDSVRVLCARHVVFATGYGAGNPNVPDIPGRDKFVGKVIHSTQYTSAEEFLDKKVVVVGACTSAHDIVHDSYNHGIDVTMFQRSATYVISKQASGDSLKELYNDRVPLEIADHYTFSTPLALLRLMSQRAVPTIAATTDKSILDGLARVGFKTNMGYDGAGIFPLWQSRGGGYYIDTGASRLIADGKIKLKSGGSIASFTRTGLRFSDDSEIAADVVIFATGFGDNREIVKDICGPDVVSKVKPVWGLDSEGELSAIYRDSGHERLWFALGNFPWSRYLSLRLAMKIKAIEEGLVGA